MWGGELKACPLARYKGEGVVGAIEWEVEGLDPHGKKEQLAVLSPFWSDLGAVEL